MSEDEIEIPMVPDGAFSQLADLLHVIADPKAARAMLESLKRERAALAQAKAAAADAADELAERQADFDRREAKLAALRLPRERPGRPRLRKSLRNASNESMRLTVVLYYKSCVLAGACGSLRRSHPWDAIVLPTDLPG